MKLIHVITILMVFILSYALAIKVTAQYNATNYVLEPSDVHFITLYNDGKIDVILNKKNIRCAMPINIGEFRTEIHLNDNTSIKTSIPIEGVKSLLWV